MALLGARGVALVVSFLVVAGVVEYLVILHIHSSQRWVPFSDLDSRLSDGFSKVDSVEVENVEAKFKKIKFFPAGNKGDGEFWEKRRKDILKEWVAIDPAPKKDGVKRHKSVIDMPAPPSVVPNKHHQQDLEGGGEGKKLPSKRNEAKKDGDKVHYGDRNSLSDLEKHGEHGVEADGELPVQKRAIDKKMEDYNYDEDYIEDIDEHGKHKEEKDLGGDGGDQKDDKAANAFDTAAKALAALSNFKKKLVGNGNDVEGGDEDDKKNKMEHVPDKNDNINGPRPYPVFSRALPGGEILVEFDKYRQFRQLTPFEEAGNNIMFTLRTTKPFHDKRLPLLFETWMRKANHSNIFIVTDGEDEKWLKKAWDENMHYILTSCGKTYLRNELCCKAGIELALIFKEGSKHYDWLCHIDDDIYVNVKQLVRFLSKFDPKKEAIYFGRSGSGWETPRKVIDGAQYGKPGQKYHFAVGGMYCLSRPMLELSRPYLIGGKNFAQSCSKTLEPEDVTVGVVVGVVLNKELSRTETIYTHGLHLGSTVDPYTLSNQIAFAYGYGAIKWGYEPYNAIYVPNALYSYTEDESQFRSLYCHLYPDEEVCLLRQKEKARKQEELKNQLSKMNYHKPNDTRVV